MTNLRHRAMSGACTVLLIVLVFALPTSLLAQTITSADLIGSWVLQKYPSTQIVFRADSTFAAESTVSGPGGVESDISATGRWRVVGDTLVFSDVTATEDGEATDLVPKTDRRLIQIKDKLLLVATTNSRQKQKPRVYERVNSPEVAPAKP